MAEDWAWLVRLPLTGRFIGVSDSAFAKQEDINKSINSQYFMGI
jgi:hypothetical protein